MGFTGGRTNNPTYHNLADHTETVDLDFDPKVTSYEELLDIFWTKHNPCSRSSPQYMSAIFYHNEEQLKLAEQTKEEMQKNKPMKITTAIRPAPRFYNAEDYHQKYLLRQHRSLLRSLDITDSELITSHVAARLNGYVGGHGNMDLFEQEKDKLGLNTDQQGYVKKLISGGRHY